jgi:hypothetical protein
MSSATRIPITSLSSFISMMTGARRDAAASTSRSAGWPSPWPRKESRRARPQSASRVHARQLGCGAQATGPLALVVRSSVRSWTTTTGTPVGRQDARQLEPSAPARRPSSKAAKRVLGRKGGAAAMREDARAGRAGRNPCRHASAVFNCQPSGRWLL